jgi:uncharacterized protein
MSPIPKKALEQHIAVLGKTGSGKSYAVRGAAVEPLLDAGARVCVIDPTGAWHGLRSSASGTRAGYSVVIFGGQHADLPLGGAHGEAIAEVIGTSSTPSILDTSLMKVSERTRFFADFADAIVRKNRGPLHLVIDEAHLFMPQGKVNDPQSGAMLHAANNMVSLGRSRGLRIILITQRPAKLHKDSLTQAETLIALRLIAPQDRAAVEAWIEDNADEGKAREIISSLATLKTGQGWIWAPELGVLERVTFPKIRTFDSGRAPDGTEGEAAKVLAPIDREAIAERLQAVSAAALADDPKRLRARIAELERQAKGSGSAASAPREALQEAERRGYERGRQDGAREAQRAAAAHLKALRSAAHKALESVLSAAPEPLPSRSMPAPTATSAAPPRRSSRTPPVRAGSNGSGEPLPRGEAATLAACIQFPDGLRREQLTVLTGYKRSSRDAYIQRLKERGYVEVRGDVVFATDAGCAALPDAEPLPTGEELQRYWFERLPEGERAILKVLVDRYPDAVPRDVLSEETNYQRSSRDAYLQRLRAKQLIVEPSRGAVQASETLF